MDISALYNSTAVIAKPTFDPATPEDDAFARHLSGNDKVQASRDIDNHDEDVAGIDHADATDEQSDDHDDYRLDQEDREDHEDHSDHADRRDDNDSSADTDVAPPLLATTGNPETTPLFSTALASDEIAPNDLTVGQIIDAAVQASTATAAAASGPAGNNPAVAAIAEKLANGLVNGSAGQQTPAANSVMGENGNPVAQAAVAKSTAPLASSVLPAHAGAAILKGGETAATQIVQATTAPSATTGKPENNILTGKGSAQKASPDAVAAQASATNKPNILESLRAESAQQMSEKDVLSNKIAEMLSDGKGALKMTKGAKAAIQTSMVSGATMAAVNNAQANPNVTFSGLTPTPTAIAEANNPQPLPAVLPVGTTTTEGVAGTSTALPTGQVTPSSEATSLAQSANTSRAAPAQPPAEQIAMQLSHAAKDGVDKFKIQLHPSELGRVDVKLELGHDGRAIAIIAAENQDTLDLLQRDARALERALQQAGFETDSGSLKFSLGQQSDDGQENHAQGSHPVMDEIDDINDLIASTQTGAFNSSPDGSLDIQV